jgi:2'-5' RNA ligase
VGRFFTSFDEAWEFFLDRDEELEDFFAQFPEEETFLLGWLLRPGDAVVQAVAEVQRSFAQLDWIIAVPDHFLHAWIAGIALARRRPLSDEVRVALERAQRAWAGATPFVVSYRRVNCFHSAVVVEVEEAGPRALAAALVDNAYWQDLPIEGAMQSLPLETFLPHVTVGVVRTPTEPTALREALVPLRDVDLGREHMSEAELCVIPASRTTLLDPWGVVGSVRFG